MINFSLNLLATSSCLHFVLHHTYIRHAVIKMAENGQCTSSYSALPDHSSLLHLPVIKVEMVQLLNCALLTDQPKFSCMHADDAATIHNPI